MATATKVPKPLLVQESKWVDPDTGRPTPEFYDYLKQIDRLARAIRLEVNSSLFGPLTQAVNDTAADTAGVPIGGLYRNGNAVQIRIV